VPERYELKLEGWLATILEQKLAEVLRAAGLRDVLHLAEPRVTQFQGSGGVVSVEMDHAGPQRRRLIVESESVAVAPLLWEAGKETISDVTEQVLGALPCVDSSELRNKISSCLAEDRLEPS